MGDVVRVAGAGSLWDNRNNLYIGYNGRGNQMIISNGGIVSNNGGYLGWQLPSSNNIVTVSGQGSLWNCHSELVVGHGDSSNVLMITDGGRVQSANCSIGSNVDHSNTAIVDGSGSVLAIQGDLWVGNQSAGNRLFVTNGATAEAANLFIGYFFPNYNASNSVLIDNGSIVATNLVDVRQGTLLLSSGLLSTAALWVTNSHGQIAFSGGTLQSGSTIHDTGTPMVVGGSATPAAFELAGTGSHIFAGGLLVASNGLVKGDGSITGNVTVAAGGSISPGASIGQLAINGALVLSNGSTTVMVLDAADGTNDSFSGLTSVTYGGALHLTNVVGIPTNGSNFKLFSAANYSGTFENLDAPSPGPGLRWNINELSVDGTLRVVSTPSPAPKITRTVLTSNNLIISGSGGIAFDPCYLLTATNVAQPVAEWVRVATNRFDSGGNVNLTNPVLQSERGRYFRLAVD
jgi:T5SS/PEP-CTERM-associated repeat protein